MRAAALPRARLVPEPRQPPSPASSVPLVAAFRCQINSRKFRPVKSVIFFLVGMWTYQNNRSASVSCIPRKPDVYVRLVIRSILLLCSLLNEFNECSLVHDLSSVFIYSVPFTIKIVSWGSSVSPHRDGGNDDRNTVIQAGLLACSWLSSHVPHVSALCQVNLDGTAADAQNVAGFIVFSRDLGLSEWRSDIIMP